MLKPTKEEYESAVYAVLATVERRLMAEYDKVTTRDWVAARAHCMLYPKRATDEGLEPLLIDGVSSIGGVVLAKAAR